MFITQVLRPASATAGDLGEFFRNWRFHRQAEGREVGEQQPNTPVYYYVDRNSSKEVKFTHIQQMRDGLKKASEHLDHVNNHVKRWGHASASQLFLFSDQQDTGGTAPESRFGIGASPLLSLESMSNAIRGSVQGAAAFSNQKSTTVAGSAGFDGTPATLLLPSASPETGASSANSSINDPFKAPTDGTPGFAQPGDLLKRYGSEGAAPDQKAGDKALQGLEGIDLGLSESDVLKIASSTIVTGKILQTMADPQGYSSDKQVFMAVTEVSVTPGTYTRRGYACEVHLRPHYSNTRIDKEPGNTHDDRHLHGPQIFAAFPLADAQTLDTAFGDRRQFQTLLTAAAKALGTGNTVSANALFNQIDRKQRDVATRNPLPVVVPNSDGTMISYRFEPSLRAVADPGNRGSQPELVLPPMSIPALVVLICDKEDLRNHAYLHMDSSARWVPLDHRHWLKRATVDWLWRGRQYTSAESTEDRFEMADRMDWVHIYLDAARPWCGPSSNDFHSFREIETRLATLEPLYGHRMLQTHLPPPLPEITSIEGGHVDAAKSELKLLGCGFKRAANCGCDSEIIRRASINGHSVAFKAETDEAVTLTLGTNASSWLKQDAALVKLETISGDVVWRDLPVSKPAVFKIEQVVPSQFDPDKAEATIAGQEFSAICSSALSKPTTFVVGGVSLESVTSDGKAVTGKMPLGTKLSTGKHAVVILSGGKAAALPDAISIGSGKKPVSAPKVLFPQKTPAYQVASAGKIFIHGANFKNLDNSSPQTEQDAILQILAHITGGTAAAAIEDKNKIFEMNIEEAYSKDKFTLPMLSAEDWKKLAKKKDNNPVEIKGDLNISLSFIWKDHSTGDVQELKDALSFVVTF